MQSQPDLFQVVFALCPARRLSGLLNCGKEQRDQNRDDRNHHQQFNQRKAKRPWLLLRGRTEKSMMLAKISLQGKCKSPSNSARQSDRRRRVRTPYANIIPNFVST